MASKNPKLSLPSNVRRLKTFFGASATDWRYSPSVLKKSCKAPLIWPGVRRPLQGKVTSQNLHLSVHSNICSCSCTLLLLSFLPAFLPPSFQNTLQWSPSQTSLPLLRCALKGTWNGLLTPCHWLGYVVMKPFRLNINAPCTKVATDLFLSLSPYHCCSSVNSLICGVHTIGGCAFHTGSCAVSSVATSSHGVPTEA